ncbi:hypothetical protein MF271_21215 (plasmid) [Deinococcus sp. KNUC1210]|uniref:hypothetical protein n=1 Tax=Deinococcus sp. KNUC1210 TaxID=2917691 RepID=UPI001EEFB71A|nr:hypothetical protein [Deinococcus sp. KNUC1210]ULH17573.1 hypothetical protein MF271_21215 [Deinococcus sp. KNUC1210]
MTTFDPASDPWIQDYILLALRLNRCITDMIDDDSLLGYHGPPEDLVRIRQEPPPFPTQLIHDAQSLAESLPTCGFAPARTTYLGALIRALETVARQVAGDVIPLRQQAYDCLDLQVDYLPEGQFIRAHALYDQALPGTGDVTARLQAWRLHYTLAPAQQQHLVTLIERALHESRQRTNRMIALPSDEKTTIEALRDVPFRAVADYLGHHRSKILINQTLPFNLAELLYVVCHEGYPGHLAELVLKEAHLTEQQHFREQQINFLLTPPFVISEGIALWAHRLAFPGDEAARWLAKHVYPDVGITPDGSQLDLVLEATDLLWGVRGNAALMLDDGCSEAETIRYLRTYALIDEAAALRAVRGLRLPLREAYIFTYHYGVQLLEPWLRSDGAHTALARLLTRQILPSRLAEQLSLP